MKVIIATPYIYKSEWPEFTRNRTGFGIMVKDIFDSISEDVDAYLITQAITKGHGRVLKHTLNDVFKYAWLRDWIRGFKFFFCYKQGFKKRLKYFYYALNAGSFRNVLNSIKPDIVHIHGIGMQIKPFIDVCEEQTIPYIVTLHGLIGLDDTIHTSPWDKQLEKTFLIEAEKKGTPVTVISTGMKQRIESNYIHHEAKNIEVINNGTRLPYNEDNICKTNINLRIQYNLQNEKIIVVCGPICERKNQVQIVKAISTGLIKTPCQFFFCGADETNGIVEKAIRDEGLSDKIHILGFLSPDLEDNIMEQADLIVTASRDEGLGLSIIRSFLHGIPTVAFSDIDVIDDLFNECSMIGIKERSDKALALGIEEGLQKDWKRTAIKKVGNSYSLEDIKNTYIEDYNIGLANGTFMPISKTIDFLIIQKILGYKVISYIGNLTDNKNQIELVKAMPVLKNEKVLSVLLGREMDGGKVRQYVLDNDLQDTVIIAGFCTEMDSIWSIANLNVLLSINDGFGLSIIEAFSHGVPTVASENLDAIQDLYDERAMLTLSDRNNTELAQSIKKGLKKQWNQNWILEYSKRFSLSNMRDKYIRIYTNTCSRS